MRDCGGERARGWGGWSAQAGEERGVAGGGGGGTKTSAAGEAHRFWRAQEGMQRRRVRFADGANPPGDFASPVLFRVPFTPPDDGAALQSRLHRHSCKKKKVPPSPRRCRAPCALSGAVRTCAALCGTRGGSRTRATGWAAVSNLWKRAFFQLLVSTRLSPLPARANGAKDVLFVFFRSLFRFMSFERRACHARCLRAMQRYMKKSALCS